MGNIADSISVILETTIDTLVVVGVSCLIIWTLLGRIEYGHFLLDTCHGHTTYCIPFTIVARLDLPNMHVYKRINRWLKRSDTWQ